MCPLQIEIMIHYYCIGADFREGDFSAPAVSGAIEYFVIDRMLSYQKDGSSPKLRITDRGRAYVEFLTKVPYPIEKKEWVLPEEER